MKCPRFRSPILQNATVMLFSPSRIFGFRSHDGDTYLYITTSKPTQKDLVYPLDVHFLKAYQNGIHTLNRTTETRSQCWTGKAIYETETGSGNMRSGLRGDT